MRRECRQETRTGGATVGAACLLALAAAAVRWVLVRTSYAAHAHWEEPVFLFGSVELARRGLSAIWDYQDDLAHGGSLPLLLLGTLWVRWFGPSILALKGIAVAWSSVAFFVLLLAVRRAWNGNAALLCGVFLLGLSPNLARLQATLVGSHPEALLPAAAALRVFAAQGGGQTRRVAPCLLFGFFAATAAWMSLTFVPWMASLALLWPFSPRRRPSSLAGLAAGGALGALPWVYQNLYLRPHGATLWLRRLRGHAPRLPSGGAHAEWGTLGFFPESWGLGHAGVPLTIVLLLAFFVLAGAVVFDRDLPPERRRFAAALLLGTLLAAVSLRALPLSPEPNEGYYFARFFVALQVQLLCTAALAAEWLANRLGNALRVLFAAAAVAMGALFLAPLFGTGGQVPPVEVLLRRGCLVFGIAEYARAGEPERAVTRLLSLGDRDCSEMACIGLGWALTDEYLRYRTATGARRALERAGGTACRKRICGGIRFVLDRRLPRSEPRTLPPEVQEYCR